jgi:hypothetical protein
VEAEILISKKYRIEWWLLDPRKNIKKGRLKRGQLAGCGGSYM